MDIQIKTLDQLHRAFDAKLETEKQIRREMAYSPAHRDMASLRFHRGHLAKLKAAIAAYSGQDGRVS
jgi:hypothetical protein